MSYIAFSTPIGFRLYDRERNKTITLHDEEYDALERISKNDASDFDLHILNTLMMKGYCNKSSLVEIGHPKMDEIRRNGDISLNYLVLQVTQNCNLRCAYCAFSGKYYNRTHSSKHMDLGIAIQAVDFLMNHSKGSYKLSMGFYGGEPLLEFNLIKEVVLYVENTYPDRLVKYSITTNLTLLSNEAISFLNEKNFNVLISIDGPEKIQNRYRVFSNGTGSFNTVQENAQRLRSFSPEFFSRCSTNTVVSPGEEFSDIMNFFDHDELFGPLQSNINLISDSASKEQLIYDDSFAITVKRERFKCYLYMLGEITAERTSPIAYRNISPLISLYKKMKLEGLQYSIKAHPGGPCVPGEKKLFVDVNGFFYPCEKTPENELYRIGSIYDGFDFDKIEKILNVGLYTTKECLSCWAFIHCSTCIVNMADKNSITREMRLARCDEVKSRLLSELKTIEVLRYYGYAFDYVE